MHDQQGTNSGATYLFDATTGQQLHKLLPSASADFDAFGYSVAIDDSALAVGVWREDYAASNSGLAQLFDPITGRRIATLLPSDNDEEDHFANAIAIDQGTIAASAWYNDDHGTNSGSIYIFNQPQPQTCPADLTGDTQLDFFDISAFLTAYATGCP